MEPVPPNGGMQMPDFTQSFNRYTYCLNNPLKCTDPDGEWIFTILAAIFCPPLLPAAISTDIGWMSGGVRATSQGQSFWYGAWRGAVVGAVGGSMGMVGGGTFVANVAWGLGEGAITGGLDAALWGNDIGKGMLWGAAIGGAFATATSSIEAYGNNKDGYGFRTNEGVLKHYQKTGNVEKLSNFFNERYGVNATIEHSPTVDKYNLNNPEDFRNGVADIKNNKILLAEETLQDVTTLKQTVIHEFGHLQFDFTPTGDFISNPMFGGDGPNGWLNEVYNSGALKIKHSYIHKLQWSNYYKAGGSLWRTLPQRYKYKISLYNFR